MPTITNSLRFGMLVLLLDFWGIGLALFGGACVQISWQLSYSFNYITFVAGCIVIEAELRQALNSSRLASRRYAQ
jgi:hypothetical protein